MEQLIQKVDDVVLWIDHGITNKKYFLLCESRETYIKLDKPYYIFFERLLPLLDGSRTLTEIELEMQETCSDSQTINNGVSFLREKGLLKDTEKTNYSKVELEMSSRNLLTLKVDKFCEKNSRYFKVFYYVLLIISLLVVGYSLVGRKENYLILQKVFLDASGFSWNGIKGNEIILIFLGFLASILFHELGHIIVAVVMGAVPKSVHLILKMGFMPMFYVKYKNYYHLTSRRKLCILLAGMWMNILQALILWNVLGCIDNIVISTAFIFNIGMCLSCFTLLGTSDGYYIIATLLGIEQFRWTMLKHIAEAIYKKKNLFKDKKNLTYLIYFILSYGMTFVSLYSLIRMVMNVFQLYFVSSKMISTIIITGICINVLFMINKFIKSL